MNWIFTLNDLIPYSFITKMASAAILPHRQDSSSPTPHTAVNGRAGLQYEKFDGTQQSRQSLLSTNSAVSSSYRTAQDQRSSFTPSISSSVNTIGPQRERDTPPLPSPTVNPIHAMAKAKTQEIHIVKVTDDVVEIESGPVPQSYFERVGKSVLHAVQPTLQAGPPPPSPPASVEQSADEEEADRFWVQDAPLAAEPLRADSMNADGAPVAPASTTTYARHGVTPAQLQRSSTDTQASYSTPYTIVTSPSPVLPHHQQSSSFSEPSSSKANAHLSVDGYLQPPPLASGSRPARRNTTGSTPLSVKQHPPHGKGLSQPYDDAILVDGGLTVELESDIELQAERIRRERMSKRAKQQQEAEAALTRNAGDQGAKDGPKDGPLVGNLIGEDHVNYVLMYNMLTGIRIGVSRCQAKIKRPLTDEDFTARHKFSFDIIGNELTPSAKYDFKFKDYAPWVFRYLREDSFQLDPADYLLSLTAKYILSELGSPGKSGSFFYFSCDYRFIIKTIRHSEHKFLLSILKKYYAHVQENPHTLLSRFYGLHRVKLPHGRKIHFVIMNNLFPPHKDVHETYDLKGSTVGREYPEDKAAQNPRAVMKDMNWINRNKMLELGPEKRALLTEQLRRDTEFLKSIHVMDYSLLVGIHHLSRGNRDNLRRNTLKVFSPVLPEKRRTKSSQVGSSSPEAIAMRRAMRSSDPKRLGKHTIRLPEEDTGDRQHFLFYQDESGLRATDENNDPENTIYYLGVIDILTPYNFFKKVEHMWKGMKADRHKISPVPPGEYGDRFFSFMKAIMRGGEGGERFTEKGEKQA